MGLAWLDRKHARRGWIALFAGAGLLALAIGLDFDYFARDGQALVLSEREWTLSSGDFPGTWSSIEQSAAFARAAEKAPEVPARIEAWMRQTTGLRWTPLRWNLWFGPVLFVSGADGAAVASVRAKFLARAGFALARATGLVDTRDGISQVSGVHIARAGRFFLIGTSAEIVSRLRSSGERWSSLGGTGIMYDTRAELVRAFNINADNEIQLSIVWGGIEHRTPARAEYFAIEWPEAPILSAVTRGVDFHSIASTDRWPEFPGRSEVERAWSDFEALLPEGWRAGADTTQFALFDVDSSETIPVVDAAVFSRSESPLLELKPPAGAIPYEWSGNAGWMTPWLGEGAQLFVVANERSRVFANQEATMAKVMARERAGRITSDDARIDIDAARLAAVLSDLARKAAREELWPERNEADVERDVVPWLNAFGALGEIAFVGKYEGEGITLRGGTHAPAKAAEDLR